MRVASPPVVPMRPRVCDAESRRRIFTLIELFAWYAMTRRCRRPRIAAAGHVRRADVGPVDARAHQRVDHGLLTSARLVHGGGGVRRGELDRSVRRQHVRLALHLAGTDNRDLAGVGVGRRDYRRPRCRSRRTPSVRRRTFPPRRGRSIGVASFALAAIGMPGSLEHLRQTKPRRSRSAAYLPINDCVMWGMSPSAPTPAARTAANRGWCDGAEDRPLRLAVRVEQRGGRRRRLASGSAVNAVSKCAASRRGRRCVRSDGRHR